MKKRIISHLKDDIKMFKREAKEDKELIKAMKHKKPKRAIKALKKDIAAGKKERKIQKVMEEFKEGKLHSGSKQGPKVKKRSQAIAIALSEARRSKRKKNR